MRRPTTRQLLLWIGLLFATTCACGAIEVECTDGADNNGNQLVDCDDPGCEDHETCTDTPEDCDQAGNQDGDAYTDDGDDPSCVDGLSPALDVACTSQDTTTTAGADTDITAQPAGCDAETASADGADRAAVHLKDGSADDGVIEFVFAFVDDGDDAPPTADVKASIEVPYAPDGNRALVAVAAIPEGGATVSATATCHSRDGYTVVVEAPGRVAPPTKPAGDSFTCDLDVSAVGAEGGASRGLVIFGVRISNDLDGDGIVDFKDRCAETPTSVVANAKGCDESGVFAFGEYDCNDADSCFFDPDPNPEFCTDCGVRLDDGTEIDTFGTDQNLLVQTDGTCACDQCDFSGEPDWHAECTDEACTYDPGGAFSCQGLENGCDLDIGHQRIDCPDDASCTLIADPAALALDGGGDAEVAQIGVETTDPAQDGLFAFEVATNGNLYEFELATFDGMPEKYFIAVFNGTATVEQLETTNWEFVGHDCSGTGAVAELSGDATCIFSNQFVEPSGLIDIDVTDAETLSLLPPNWAGVAPAEALAINGANGFQVLDASDFSPVPRVTRVNGFSFRNLLGAMWLTAPTGPNDGLFYWTIPSGIAQTQWFPELNDFGAQGIGFAGVRDGAIVAGDPTRGVYVDTSGTVTEVLFQDFGTEQLFLTSQTDVASTALPVGFVATSAFKTSLSDQVFIVARNTTPDTPGQVFLAETATPFRSAVALLPLVNEVAIPLSAKCAFNAPAEATCFVSDIVADAVHVFRWSVGTTAALLASIASGEDPHIPAITVEDGDVLAAVPNLGDDSRTLIRVDGATDAVTSSTAPLINGCTAPSSALFLSGGGRIVYLATGSDKLCLENAPDPNDPL
jgi:hypothetical protein